MDLRGWRGALIQVFYGRPLAGVDICRQLWISLSNSFSKILSGGFQLLGKDSFSAWNDIRICQEKVLWQPYSVVQRKRAQIVLILWPRCNRKLASREKTCYLGNDCWRSLIFRTCLYWEDLDYGNELLQSETEASYMVKRVGIGYQASWSKFLWNCHP